MTASSLRLAIDVGPLYGHRTGVGVAVAGIIDALDAQSTIETSPYLVSFRSAPSSGHRRLPVPGIVASHLWARIDRPRADRWLRGVDVVHGTNYVAPPSSLPTVVSVYDCWFLRHPEAATPLVRRAGATLRRRVADGAWVHTSSEATAAAVAALLDTDRVVAIHLGPPSTAAIDEQRPPELDESAGSRYIVAIGTEERRKDLPTLIKAFGHLSEAVPDVLLVLAGATGDQSGEIDAAIEALPHHAKSQVRRLGVVDESAKRWLLRHAAVLAYPSLDEGFGFPILEAQAVGTPVVASDVGAVAEIAGPGAVLVTDRSPESFAQHLTDVIDGSVSRLSLIAAGHENLARFSWNSTADALVGLYTRALEAG